MKNRICTSCYYVGKPTTQGIGSFFVDAMIWLVFISLTVLSAMIPLLLIPMAWTTFHLAVYNKTTCPKCGRLNMVSLNSRKGRKAQQGPTFVVTYAATDDEAEKLTAATQPEKPVERRSRN